MFYGVLAVLDSKNVCSAMIVSVAYFCSKEMVYTTENV